MAIKPTMQAQRAKQTREVIVRSAMALFQEYGCDKVTIDDICANCSLSKGAFYHNFPSKDHIVVLSFNLCMDAYLDEHFTLDDTKPCLEQLIDLDVAVMNFCKQIGKSITASAYEAAIRSNIDVRLTERTYVSMLSHLVHRGLGSDVFQMGLGPDETYMMLVAVFSGMLVKWCTQPDEKDLELDWEKILRAQLGQLARTC